MKKLLVVLIICLTVLSFSNRKELTDFANSFSDSTVTVYADKFNDKIDYIDNCGLKFFTVKADEGKNLLKNATDVRGITITFQGDKNDVDDYLKKLNAKEVYREKVQNVLIVYGYSDSIKRFVVVNDNKVNVEIAFDNKKVTVGSPIILGSY